MMTIDGLAACAERVRALGGGRATRGARGAGAASALRLATAMALTGVLLAGCAKYRVELENQTQRTIYAGIIERSAAGGQAQHAGAGPARMLTTAIARPGETVAFSASGSGASGAAYSLMVGDSPSPRDRAIYMRLDAGFNGFTVRQPAAPASSARRRTPGATPAEVASPIFVERKP